MFKWILVTVGIVFTALVVLAIYAGAIPEFFGLVTRLVTYSYTNLPPVMKSIWNFGWGLILEFLSACEDFVMKIAPKFLGS